MKPARVKKSVKIGLISTITVDIIIILLREPLIGIFTDNAEIIRLGSQVLLFSIVLETARTCNMIMINSLRAGDARFPVYMGLISMVGVSLPLGYWFVFHLNMGLLGVWVANAVDEWIRAFIMHYRWKNGAWRRYALVERPASKDSESVSARYKIHHLSLASTRSVRIMRCSAYVFAAVKAAFSCQDT